MTIQVELIDGTFCRVVPKGLNLLLNRELVKRFRRSSGWAVVGKDPIRYTKKQVRLQRPGTTPGRLTFLTDQSHSQYRAHCIVHPYFLPCLDFLAPGKADSSLQC